MVLMLIKIVNDDMSYTTTSHIYICHQKEINVELIKYSIDHGVDVNKR